MGDLIAAALLIAGILCAPAHPGDTVKTRLEGFKKLVSRQKA